MFQQRLQRGFRLLKFGFLAVLLWGEAERWGGLAVDTVGAELSAVVSLAFATPASGGAQAERKCDSSTRRC